MSKKTEKGIAPMKWNKIILVETGEGFVTREDHVRRCCRPSALYSAENYEVEEVIFETSDTSLVQLVQSMMEQTKEIDRLKGVIKGYQEATDKIMKEAQ